MVGPGRFAYKIDKLMKFLFYPQDFVSLAASTLFFLFSAGQLSNCNSWALPDYRLCLRAG